MKKHYYITSVLAVLMIMLVACGNNTLNIAKKAVESYNAQADEFNKRIESYNDVISKIESKNQELQKTVDSAQSILNEAAQPFDETTSDQLKKAIEAALKSKCIVPSKIEVYPEIDIDNDATKDELIALEKQADTGIENMKNYSIPDVPTMPDYTLEIQAISEARQLYEDSIQSLKQITAPSDLFVIERLQKIDTITEVEAVTEDHDPNAKLNKQGGYIGCVYFSDSQVDKFKLHIEAGKEGAVDVGCIGGGALEIYSTIEDAQARDAYLATFDETAFTSGSHNIYGTIIIRTSEELNATQQQDLTDKILQALIRVQH